MIIIYILEVVIAKMVLMMMGMVNMRTNVKLLMGMMMMMVFVPLVVT